MNKKSNLPVPSGTESLHLHEAFIHRALQQEIEEVFIKWGYFPVQTPVFDFYDQYASLMDDKRKDETYRLIDREGELLMLRSDITLFIAKQLSSGVDTKDLPLRAFYGDTILRHQDKEDISHNEFFQSGCELVGNKGLDTDLESLVLLYEILKKIPLDIFRIHIGSRNLLNCVLKKMEIEKEELIQSILSRDIEEVSRILLTNFSENQMQNLKNLFFFIGTTAEFKDFTKTLDISDLPEINEELLYLQSLTDQLELLSIQESFRLDLSEIGSQTYYSGLIFQAYTPGADSAIASGGRYDHLIHRGKESISSVGFSILQRKLENILPKKELPTPVQLDRQGSFSSRYQEAQKLRKTGRSVAL